MSPKQSSLMLSLLVAVAVLVEPPATLRWELQDRPAKPIHVEASLVLVETTVKDERGNLVDGLTADDFRVLDDGSQQAITYFSRDELPLAVALMVDVSASIIPYFDNLQDDLQTGLTALKHEDEVALFVFTFEVEKRADLTADKSIIGDRLEGIRIGGSTNLNEALYRGAQYLAERAPAMRRVIILVSDNVPSQVSEFSPKDVENEIFKADAAVYSLKIPGENSPGVQRYIDRARGNLVEVDKVVSHAGGEVIEVNKGSSLSAAFAKLVNRIKARYTLGYTPLGHPLRDGRYHSVEAHLTTERCNHCRVEAKRGYFGAPAPRGKK